MRLSGRRLQKRSPGSFALEEKVHLCASRRWSLVPPFRVPTSKRGVANFDQARSIMPYPTLPPRSPRSDSSVPPLKFWLSAGEQTGNVGVMLKNNQDRRRRHKHKERKGLRRRVYEPGD